MRHHSPYSIIKCLYIQGQYDIILYYIKQMKKKDLNCYYDNYIMPHNAIDKILYIIYLLFAIFLSRQENVYIHTNRIVNNK